MTSDVESLKREAAREALTRVKSGMRLGLGTGSTMVHFIDLLGEALHDGRLSDLVGVPTSVRTGDQARAVGVPLADLDAIQPLDLAVDGADEVDPSLELVKGLGGALLREKMVVQAAGRFVVIADESKRVSRLATRAPLPVEVVPFSWKAHLDPLRALGGEAELRRDETGEPVLTDNGNHLLDMHFEDGIKNPLELDHALHGRAGVVETGLFLGVASEVILAGADGVQVLTREPGS